MTIYRYCPMARERGEEWRGNCNVTLCSYYLRQENSGFIGGVDIM